MQPLGRSPEQHSKLPSRRPVCLFLKLVNLLKAFSTISYLRRFPLHFLCYKFTFVIWVQESLWGKKKVTLSVHLEKICSEMDAKYQKPFFTWNLPLVDFLRGNFTVSFHSYFITCCYVLLFPSTPPSAICYSCTSFPTCSQGSTNESTTTTPKQSSRERTVGSIVVSAN